MLARSAATSGSASRAVCCGGARRASARFVRRRGAPPDSLVAEQELGVAPALVLLADQVVAGHADVVEEHLVDLAAVDQLDRADGDARGLHRRSGGTRCPALALRPRGRCARGRRSSRRTAPSVVQVFCPLTTQSSPSRHGRVFSEARSEPALGSEKPWHHQMSRFAVAGRNRSFCSWRAEVRDHRATMLALNASGGGTHASCSSSCQMCRCSGVQSWPPHSTGQFGTASPAWFRICCVCTITVLADMAAGRDRVADLLRDLGGEERAHLLAESALLVGEMQLHAARLPGGR